ncbi:MAG: InlB B-repeat-containing protein [Acholeplasmatales bacterium]|nr:InlB B-repeat-containing protein [Acholeplasmatales bacterium]
MVNAKRFLLLSLSLFVFIFVLASCDSGTNNNDTNNTNTNEITKPTEEKTDFSTLGLSLESKSFKYDGTEKTLTITGNIPSDLIVSYTGKGTDAGKYTITAHFTDTNNKYKNVKDLTAEMTIEKADYDLTNVQFNDMLFDYDEQNKTASIVGNLPEGLTVSFEGDNVSEIGSYDVVAHFSNSNKNYNDVADKTAKLIINKGNNYHYVTFKDASGNELLKKLVKDSEALTDIPSVPAKDGYTGIWNYTFDSVTTEMECVPTYTANKYTITYDVNSGDALSSTTQEVTYDTEYTLVTPTKEGYTFKGWFIGENKVEDGTWTSTSNITLVANWEINKYTITIVNQATGVIISGITSDNEYEYDTEIILSSTNIPSGYTIKWSRSDDIEYVGDNYKFNVPAANTTITVTTTRPYIKNGNKIYFGTYPQTKVEATIENSLLGIEFDKSTWTSYKYYMESTQQDYMYYKDVDIDNNGIYDYRGVYFTQYRPYYPNNSSADNIYTYQDNNGYNTNEIYWFSYDRIEWNILKEENGKALIIANLLLDSQDYYPSSSSSSFTHIDGEEGYANNYELSTIRKFLNENFYNIAFNDLQKILIEKTIVDNSESSTGDDPNSYVCNNTEDKIFLLSYQEANNIDYFANDIARQAQGSDYAKCQGLKISTDDPYAGYSFWWLRSPYYDYAYFVSYVTPVGNTYNYIYVKENSLGVRPACWINL